MSIVSPNSTPSIHLICNAHLDPVWQWRWEEGAAEALATFRNAVEILDEHPHLIFCHNEAVLYQWVERYDPALFKEILRLVRAGRWAISGGWFIQPDVNLPGTESLIRQMAEGRRYFREKFGVVPRVAYNFDSFGHSGGLPQILRLAGYEMYIHMRPQSHELVLPADLYRWRGADGTVIPAYRISIGLYHTERDNIEDRLRAGVALALKLGRDVPVFWGLGNHGGGATRQDLRTIDRFIASTNEVRIIHGTPDGFYDAVREAAERAPVHEGDLQRSFTGCYTSLSRLKRRAQRSLGTLVQSEALAAAAWWLRDLSFPTGDLREAWRLHLFNDFHDIITGSCVEPAEQDALDQYGRAEDIARGLRLGAVAALVAGGAESPPLPLTVANANPSIKRAPIEFECLADYRPFWKGKWHLRLFRPDGTEVPSQEEPPEALLPFNDWRRRLCFIDDLPGVGVSSYFLKAFEGQALQGQMDERERRGHIPKVHVPDRRPSNAVVSGAAANSRDLPWGQVSNSRAISHAAGMTRSRIWHDIDRKTGLVIALRTLDSGQCLAGPLFEPLVIEDTGDSWGTECWNYRKIAGRFKLEGRPCVLTHGPVRTVTQATFIYNKSRIIVDTYSYPDWPALEFRLRIIWNEERRRLKLRIPTKFSMASVLCEVPGAALQRPADGGEHVHGRWLMIAGNAGRRRAALGIVGCGQHGFDFREGEVRLSVLRSAAYCHERGFDLGAAGSALGTRATGPCPLGWKFSDIGVHDVRLLVTAGGPEEVRLRLPALADYLNAPPAVYAHLPIGSPASKKEEHGGERSPRGDAPPNHVGSLVTLHNGGPANVRLLACKQSWDGEALVLRLQETAGRRSRARLSLEVPGFITDASTAEEMMVEMAAPPTPRSRRRRNLLPRIQIPLAFKPYEIITVRVGRDGRWSQVRMIEEKE